MWVPLLVISELTGIEEATRLRDWYDTIMAGGTSSIGNPGARAAALQAMQELKEFLVPLLAERRVNPGSDLVSDLVAARYDGAPLPDDEIVSIVGQLLPAGVETTERVLTSAFRLLCADRPLWDQLCEVRDSDDALASFGAEALRCYPPIQAANRVALADTVVAGQPVAAGEKVVALLASANRDPSRFADPDRFDARAVQRQPRPPVHVRRGGAAVRSGRAPLHRLPAGEGGDRRNRSSAAGPCELDRPARRRARRRWAGAVVAGGARGANPRPNLRVISDPHLPPGGGSTDNLRRPCAPISTPISTPGSTRSSIPALTPALDPGLEARTAAVIALADASAAERPGSTKQKAAVIVAKRIVAAVERERLEPGDKLPPERDHAGAVRGWAQHACVRPCDSSNCRAC